MTSEELREKILQAGMAYKTHCGCKDCERNNCDVTTAILSLLETAMQGVIGEDELASKGNITTPSTIEQFDRNRLRAEQRSNLLALVRGEK